MWGSHLAPCTASMAPCLPRPRTACNKQVGKSSSYLFSFVSLKCVPHSRFFPRVTSEVLGVFTENRGDVLVTRNMPEKLNPCSLAKNRFHWIVPRFPGSLSFHEPIAPTEGSCIQSVDPLTAPVRAWGALQAPRALGRAVTSGRTSLSLWPARHGWR